ncbi:hypothetical protein P376_2272 [Streptomyces sp. HCCB10043]|nr:hypothetical protein P376_2272 [Streptomyces sp. HCCB10043]
MMNELQVAPRQRADVRVVGVGAVRVLRETDRVELLLGEGVQARAVAADRLPEAFERERGGRGEVDQQMRVLPPFAEGPLPLPREAGVQMPEPPRDGRDRYDVGLRLTGERQDLLDPFDAHTPVLGDLRDGHPVRSLPRDLRVLARRDLRRALVDDPGAGTVRPGRHRLLPAPDRPAAGRGLPEVLLVAEPVQADLGHLPRLVELFEQNAQPVGPLALVAHVRLPRRGPGRSPASGGKLTALPGGRDRIPGGFPEPPVTPRTARTPSRAFP